MRSPWAIQISRRNLNYAGHLVTKWALRKRSKKRQLPFIGRACCSLSPQSRYWRWMTPATNNLPKNTFLEYCLLGRVWGSLEVGKVWGSCRLPGDGPDHPGLARNSHAPPHLFIIGQEPPGPALPMAPEKEKLALSASGLHLHPPCPLLLFLSSPGRTGDSSSLNKASLPHCIHEL
jgi:hypothetical protein